MSASYRSAMETPSATIAALQRLPSEIRTPIAQVIPYLSATFSFLKLVFGFLISLFSPFLRLSPLPILAYLFAPLLVFLDITATIFVRAPYRTVTYLLEAVFPLYVFIGVACITGILLGLAARVMCRVLVASLQPEESTRNAEGLKPPVVTKEPDLVKAEADLKKKPKKADKIKFES